MEIAFLILLGAIGSLVVLAMRQPDTFRIARMRYMVAQPPDIFPFLNAPREASKWSPFENDPAMKKVYSGPASGVGAKMAWEGNKEVGTGDIEIVESQPNQRVVLRLRMTRPMACNNEVVYELEAVDGGTEVTWSMSGPQPFIGKVINTVINCDRMVGQKFEQGLVSLKALVEKTN